MHSNQLKYESSPYLLQHANNPVHWFAWGDAALQAAKEEQKPILVSIGYAACHWCHVMEKESFENEATAAVMNEHFINIKIDREERPDLDHIYMDAVQAIAGNGGWPLNVFLTPDAKPFYGGTYFPPQKAYGRNSWTDVLLSIFDAWKNRREEIEEQAAQLTTHIAKANNFAAIKNIVPQSESDQLFTKNNCEAIAENILKNADRKDGGFGAPPKFLQTGSLQYLFRQAHFFGYPLALQHAEHSLQSMINGGIYDQVGGGISRYSTDAHWLVPHFEKMLYDNALLVLTLCDAYQMTKKNLYADAIRDILSFISREMKHPDGGYYAAIDADSEGVEGKFYVWQKEEVEQLLGEDAALYCAYYNVSAGGNWEHQNILHVTRPLEAVAKQLDIELEAAQHIIASANEKILEARNKRIRPITDDKILLGWNALLLTAFCRAFSSLGEESYKAAAQKLFHFLEKNLADKNYRTLLHTYKDGVARFPAFLDDHAWYIQACFHLQEISGDQDYLLRAKSLTEYVVEQFSDTESPFFFYTRAGQGDVIVRKIELYDGATPSANAVMAGNLAYLSIVFDEKEWRNRSLEMLQTVSGAVLKHPGSFSIWALGFQQESVGINELVITGGAIEMLRKEVLSAFIPNRVLQSSEYYINMSLLNGKSFSDKGSLYLCRNYACEAPVSTVAELLNQLKNN
ncbi:thioredoxin domain-containing protein [Ferruginibacter sp. HRS2-29]|uniref:thioredoxin domain-containing protein n=1 Tax=Ferruginibacter sp. HRS2-29 TaxID=2487334 RepID=UPI0020CE221A|nr:thioredoxin domain-containing protein [Ferruginibacter sp. HRS2-29]MCP9751727.1 thioredoxin domain-containing protein [Ferruginibacter sp. HRS2-29]